MQLRTLSWHARFWMGEGRRRSINWTTARLPAETALLVQQALERRSPPVLAGVGDDWRSPAFASSVQRSDRVSESVTISVPVESPIAGTDGHFWPTVHVHQLGEVTVDRGTGLAFIGERVLDASANGGRPAQISTLLSGAGLRLSAAQHLPYIDEVIAPFGQIENYFHFVTDTLPRICAVRAVHPEAVIALCGLQKSPPRFVHEALDLLDVPVRTFASPGLVRARAVVLCDGWPRDWPHPVVVRDVRDAVLAAIDDRVLPSTAAPDMAAPRGVYISRAGSSRSFDDEAWLESEVPALGLAAVRTEEVAFVEQVRLMNSADIVVAPHGAGLSNVMFMRPGTHVVELTTGEWWTSCFRNLAAVMGVRHSLVVLPRSPAHPHGRADEVLTQLRQVMNAP